MFSRATVVRDSSVAFLVRSGLLAFLVGVHQELVLVLALALALALRSLRVFPAGGQSGSTGTSGGTGITSGSHGGIGGGGSSVS